ncbi:MAG TPA: gephyrin-like molybdotransferase Glp [Abditibacteriaceae bacterium]|jgi:molybdopterin molybdotransferase
MKEMVSPAEALALVLETIRSCGEETVSHNESLGRVLARDVISPVDLPPFRNSAMDGYAVRCADLQNATENPVELPVSETIAAGQMPSRALRPNECARIMTGAALPDNADAVVMREETEERGATTVFRTSPAPDEFIRPQGHDIARGELALSAGTLVRAAEWGMLASLEQREVVVARRPRIALIVTGDEVIPAPMPLQSGQIRDSNSFTLRALAQECGAEVELFRVGDDAAQLRALFEQEGFDGFVTSGGISAGDFDIVRDVLPQMGEIVFYRVAMKPGKPVMFAHLNGVPVWALPGNPVSVMVAFELFVRPALLQMQGRSAPRLEVEAVVDGAHRSPQGKVEWVRARIVAEVRSIATVLVARISGDQGSGRLSTMTQANALLEIPADVTQLNAGDRVRARLLGTEI